MRTAKRNITEDKVVLRIMESLKLQGHTEKELIEAIGLANGTFTAWKYKNGKSYMLHIDKISDYLGVSPDYLLRGIDDEVNMDVMSETEIILIKMFRQLNYSRQKSLMMITENYLQAEKYEKITRITT
jgi:transcriptional regulator with XRE-family HTH domain